MCKNQSVCKNLESKNQKINFKSQKCYFLLLKFKYCLPFTSSENLTIHEQRNQFLISKNTLIFSN